MPEIKRDGPLISIGENIRIEAGPARLSAVATDELLGAATADHYTGPRPATDAEIEHPLIDTSDGMVYAKDALGNPIKPGQPMDYLDWVGFREGRPESTRFYLYRYIDRADPSDHIDPKVWSEIGVYETEDAALAAAFAIGEA